jgi:hypothetical protein
VDVCGLATMVEDLRRQLAAVTIKLDQLCVGGVKPASVANLTDWPGLLEKEVNNSVYAQAVAAPSANVTSTGGAYAKVVANCLPKTQPVPRYIVRVSGKKTVPTSNGKGIQAIQRRVTAFIGRLHNDTTEDDNA